MFLNKFLKFLLQTIVKKCNYFLVLRLCAFPEEPARREITHWTRAPGKGLIDWKIFNAFKDFKVLRVFRVLKVLIDYNVIK